MKNITIDLRMIESSGIGTYLQNLIPQIVGHEENVFFLLGDCSKIRKYIKESRNIILIEMKCPIYGLKEQFELYKRIPKETDLLWIPHFNIPLLYKGKLIVTIHDVFHIAMPQYIRSFFNLKQKYAELMFREVNKKSNAILVNSEFTRKELIRLINADSSKMKMTHIGVSNKWFNITKEKIPHNKPYILYVGNVKPHKNLRSLIAAFSLLKEVLPHDLVIVGKKEGFITGDNQVMEMATILGERVVFTGHIQQNILEQFYIHADVFVFPSKYEGFGLPPLEAMASGCPVIVANVASLPEVCGDAALYCDPYNPQDIAEKIKTLFDNPDLHETLRQKGLQQARLFTWEKCASQVWQAIEGVLEG